MKQNDLRTCSACCAMIVTLMLQTLLLHVLQAKPLQEQFRQIRVSGQTISEEDFDALMIYLLSLK